MQAAQKSCDRLAYGQELRNIQSDNSHNEDNDHDTCFKCRRKFLLETTPNHLGSQTTGFWFGVGSSNLLVRFGSSSTQFLIYQLTASFQDRLTQVHLENGR